MFTGIVEQKGRVAAVAPGAEGIRLSIAADTVADQLEVGDSVAVNGVCLTVVESRVGRFSADVVKETLDRTNLGGLSPRDEVDLERPMAADGRFDGHIVQGHVDGTGRILATRSEADSVRMLISVPDSLERYIVEKGSITVDGVSLTVAAVGEQSFEVALIPHTLEVTVLGGRTAGDIVNLETDVLAKYVERLLRGER